MARCRAAPVRRLAAGVLFAVLAATPAAAQSHDDAIPGAPDAAYVDAGARELVRLARARLVGEASLITAYETVARERMSVKLSALAVERLVYRRETVSRVQWARHDTIRIEVLGAREVVPVAGPGVRVPAGLDGALPRLAFDPADAELLLRVDSRALRHPLAPGAETDYRYTTGDTAVIRLPNGRTVRLRELRVQARRRDPRLVHGSFWLDAGTHAIVRAYITMSRAYDTARDGDNRSAASRLLPTARLELSHVAIEYGLWEMTWWLPRLISAEGSIDVGRARLPVQYERTYGEYGVTAAGAADTETAGGAAVPAAGVCRPAARFVVNVPTGRGSERAEAGARARGTIDTAHVAVRAEGCSRDYVVTAAGSIDLRTSAHLSDDIFADRTLLSDAELREIRARVAALPQAPWRLETPRVQLGGVGLTRYNRVEGFSLGARTALELGRAEADAELRAGVPSGEIGVRLGLAAVRRGQALQLNAYRRVDAMDPFAPAFSVGASLGALLLARDEHDYFRSSGIELRGSPAGAASPRLAWRVYAERQRTLDKATDFSIRHALDDARTFRPNPSADAAGQLGAGLVLRAQHGANPAAPRVALELRADAETGSFDFVRGAATLRFGAPLARRFTAGLEAAAGTSAGTLPFQRAWRIGGAQTVRGYALAAASGESFWRARAELATRLPLARVALFSDIGWAGPRELLFTTTSLSTRNVLWAAGAGLSALDGLLRVDLARPVRGPGGWRAHVYVNGVL